MSKYKRDDKEFKAQVATRVDGLKPFQKIEPRIVTATIDDNGDVLFLASGANDVFLELGNVVTKRASHVEPYHWGYRVVFHILRWFGDKTQIAEWTRHWPVVWRVNTKPVGGPILRWKHLPHNQRPSEIYWGQNEIAVWLDRQEAIEAEIQFLNRFFLEGI